MQKQETPFIFDTAGEGNNFLVRGYNAKETLLIKNLPWKGDPLTKPMHNFDLNYE